VRSLRQFMRDIFSCFLPGPITDQLVRKAYVAGYDRRLRHPAWVRRAVPAHRHFSDSGDRQQSTSPSQFCGKIRVPRVRTPATGRRATSRRMKVYRRRSVPNSRITSEVGTTGGTWFLPPMPSYPRMQWMRHSCYPTLPRRLALGSTVIVSCSVEWLLVLLTNDLPDWAYVEDWCRRLTGSFSDVYVFTIPLYLPKQGLDGKWRVASIFLNTVR
jgi:endonuclease G